MTETRIALLPDRGVVSVTGVDAAKLLQGIITNDMDLLAATPAIHAALLSAQGKVLFEFFVVKSATGYLLETGRQSAHGLAQRLSLYKLRAQAEISDVSADYTVAALWGGSGPSRDAQTQSLSFRDPRLAALGWRELVTLQSDWVLGESGATAATSDHYHEHRIALGVPEAERDYKLGDTFPHEALMDQLAGVSFDKGCYVGQEVVSRMQHRGTVRKRVVPLIGQAPLPAPGTELTAGTATIGLLGSTAGARGLALLRLDRAAEMAAKGEPLMAGHVEVRIEPPEWATFRLAEPDQPAAP